jgi:adenylate kinase
MIILLGPVGAGKSVQAQILVDTYGYKWISTGELLRQTTDPEVQAVLHSGKLVDDVTVKRLLHQEIASTPIDTEVIIDGFPRRISQAEWLDGQQETLHRTIDHVLHITLSEEAAIERMTERGRHDDSKEAIAQRTKTYMEQVLPVVSFYKQRNVLHEIDGSGTVEEVAARIKGALAL